MEQDVLRELIGDLLTIDGALVVVDTSGAIAEMYVNGPTGAEFGDGWVNIESGSWHVHLNASNVEEVQFVEAEDRHHDIPKLYYVRLSDADEKTVIRFYFPNPWLNDEEHLTEFQPDRLRRFEEFRDRYVGRAGIVFARRS